MYVIWTTFIQQMTVGWTRVSDALQRVAVTRLLSQTLERVVSD